MMPEFDPLGTTSGAVLPLRALVGARGQSPVMSVSGESPQLKCWGYLGSETAAYKLETFVAMTHIGAADWAPLARTAAVAVQVHCPWTIEFLAAGSVVVKRNGHVRRRKEITTFKMKAPKFLPSLPLFQRDPQKFLQKA